MSCLGLKGNFTSIIPYKFSKINKWKIFRRQKRYPRHLHRHRNFALVHVDELYTHPKPVQVTAASREMGMPGGSNTKRESDKGIMDKGSDTSARFVSSSGSNFDFKEMDDVDLRAEIFITKFKEEMRRQTAVV